MAALLFYILCRTHLISSDKPPIISIESTHREHTTQAVFNARQGFLKFQSMVAEEGLEPPTRGL